jgi:hypothetical protein
MATVSAAAYLAVQSRATLPGISVPCGKRPRSDPAEADSGLLGAVLQGLSSAFRDPRAKYRVCASVRADAYGRDICETASDEASKKFHAEAACDQEVLRAGQLRRDEFERPALVGLNDDRHARTVTVGRQCKNCCQQPLSAR